jgi:tetratricopeptide (TPR) repeat protein
VGLAQESDATNQDKVRAYSILQEAIRRHPDLSDVRVRLVDYTIRMRAYGEALDHIDYLRHQNSEHPELKIDMAPLELKAAQSYSLSGEQESALKKLYQLLGYDEATRQFVGDRAPGKSEIDAFDMLSAILMRTDMARADEVMAKCVEWNPDSAKAHLHRGNFLIRTAAAHAQAGTDPAQQEEVFKTQIGEAQGELNRAFEIAPEDVDVLLTLAGFSINAKDYVKAKELIDKAHQVDAKRADVYFRLYQLAMAQQDLNTAAAHLEEGVKQATDPQILLPVLVQVQLQRNDAAAARAACKAMQDKGTFPLELTRFFEARIKLAEGEFGPAARELEAVRPAIARSPAAADYLQQLDASLARCYEVQGQADRQLATYRRLLEVTPGDIRFRIGEATALQALGRFDEAQRDLTLLARNANAFPAFVGSILQLLLADQMRRPAADRDWTDVDKVASILQDNPERGELEKTLLAAEIELMKGEVSKDTERQVVAASKENAKDARIWLTLLKILNRDNPDNVSKLLTRAEKEAGDLPAFRAERIRLIVRQHGDDAVAELGKLEQGLDKFKPAEQQTLHVQLGAAYMQLGSYENAVRCWKAVMDQDRTNSSMRQLLLELAVDHHDAALADQIVKEMRESRQWGLQSPLYQYCAATAMLAPINQRMAQADAQPLSDADRATIAEAKKLVEEAMATRREWSALWRVRAEIDQLEGNIDGAIEDYKLALEANQSGQAVIARRLVNLLYRKERFGEADEAMKMVGDVQATDPLHKMSQRILIEKGDTKKALELAANDVKSDPKNIGNVMWYGRLLEQANRLDEAERAYRRAATLSPDSIEGWLMLVRVLVINKKLPEAVEAVREASKTLDKNKLAMAKFYELVNENQQAEELYQAALAEKPDDLNTMRQVAEFYFRNAKNIEGLQTEGTQNAIANAARAKYVERLNMASPLLEKILKKTGTSTKADEAATAAWARRAQAEVVASPGDYEHALAATKLIDQNAKNGKLSAEDSRAKLALLVNRSDVASRAESIRILEQIREQRELTPNEQFALGQLYERVGKWGPGKELIVNALSVQGNDASAIIKLVAALIVHEEYEDAARWLDKLDEVILKLSLRASEAFRPTAGEMRARVLARTGKQQEAEAVLKGVNVLPRPLSTGQLPRLEEVARVMEQLNMNEAAEELLNEYKSQDPRGTIAVAAFLGRQGKLDRAFELLDESRKNQSATELLPCGLDAMRRHPDQATPERFSMLEQWAKAGLQTEPDPVQIKLLLAELYDLQGKYDEVIKIYRELLTSKDATPTQTAIVKNNLAFILAINRSAENAAEAMKLTADALRVMGPVSDLLDTRALAYLAQGKTTEAVADLKAANSEAPASANKLFHLAQAEFQANNRDAARDALARADKIGVDVNRLTPLEKKTYQQLKDELK